MMTNGSARRSESPASHFTTKRSENFRSRVFVVNNKRIYRSSFVVSTGSSVFFPVIILSSSSEIFYFVCNR